MTSFEITSHPQKVVLDGHDITDNVTAADVYMEAGKPAEIQVWVKEPATLYGEGVVVVHEPPDEETLTDAIKTFLESLDARQVQEAANALPAVWSTPPAENVIKAILGAL